ALELRDRTAELFTPVGVGHGLLVSALGKTERHRRRTDTLSVIGIHQVRKTVPEPALRHEQHLGRHFEIVEDQLALRDPAQAQRRLALADDQPLGGVELGMAHEDEPADALLGAALVEHAPTNQVPPPYSPT